MAGNLSDPNELAALALPKRLGKNLGRYFGETIDLQAVLSDCLAAADAHGWKSEELHSAPKQILALTRKRNSSESPPGRHIYISTGIHGDEPAGPLALRQLLQENRWPAELSLWVCPCLNPAGFAKNQRENDDGLDLNREYLSCAASETRAHIAWLEQQPAFDLCLCLHEDWESHGFYVYELNPEGKPSLAPAMVEAVGRVCPVDPSELIEGREACGGIIRPSVVPRDRPQWPESFYLLTHKTRLSYTLEAPSDFPLGARVAALVAAVNAALAAFV